MTTSEIYLSELLKKKLTTNNHLKIAKKVTDNQILRSICESEK